MNKCRYCEHKGELEERYEVTKEMMPIAFSETFELRDHPDRKTYHVCKYCDVQFIDERETPVVREELSLMFHVLERSLKDHKAGQ